MLANTKFTSQPGYIGRLYGPSLPGNLQYCLRFYYAIYGFLKMSDTLAVYIFEENHVVQEKMWSVLESPRGVWLQAEITFKKPMPTKVGKNLTLVGDSGNRLRREVGISCTVLCSFAVVGLNVCLMIVNW